MTQTPSHSSGNIGAGGDVAGSILVSGSHNVVTLSAAQAAQTPELRRYLRMLTVIASPIADETQRKPPASPPLDLWGEWERLHNAINVRDPVAGAGPPWAVIRLAPPTIGALGDALTPVEPGYQVLHLSCHATPQGVRLEDNLGCERFVPTADLVSALAGSTVQLVVLNACETEQVAERLVQEAGIPTVIATYEPIYDVEAKVLSERLYRRLSAGATVGAALTEARRTIVERIERGDLPISAPAADRADNLLLVGDPDTTLTLDAETNSDAAETPVFIRTPTPHNDPLPWNLAEGFVGRLEEQVRLARWFRQTGERAFALSGVGGVGKSALALVTALRHAHRFEAVAFASARDADEFGPLEVLEALNGALGTTLSQEEADDLPAAVARRLREHAVLLVLDNLETIRPKRARELAQALRGFPVTSGSRVLMTLRPRQKDPLTKLAAGNRLRLDPLDAGDALHLAWNEAQRQNFTTDDYPDVSFSEEEKARLRRLRRRLWLAGAPLDQLAALEQLARRAFRHPKMIELAVSMAAPHRHGWGRTRRRLEQMRGRDLQEALEELIGQMVADLRADEPQAVNTLFAALTFRGGAEDGRLRYVALGDDVADDSGAAIEYEDEMLQPALDANLLTRAGDRYDVDPPVHAYLRQHLPDDWDEYVYRHAEAHLPVVADYDDAIREGRMTYAAPLEWPNVTAVWERLSDSADTHDRAAQLLVDHARHWRNTIYNNYDPRRLRWVQAAVRAADRIGDDWDKANTLQAIGDVYQFRKQLDDALDHYEQARERFIAVGDRLGEANTLAGMGRVALLQDDQEKADSVLKEAITIYNAIGDRYSVPAQIGNYGWTLHRMGENEQAVPYFLQAAELFEDMGLDDYAERHRRAAGGDS